MKRNITVLAFILMIGLCGCNKNNDKNKSDVQGSTEIITTENQMEIDERAVINDFYDSMYTLNQNLINHNYTSLEDEVAKTFSSIETFEEYAVKEDLYYREYFDTVKNNPMYKNFKSEYYDDPDMYDLDYYLTTDGYNIIIQTNTEAILQVELPFENDKQELATETDSSINYEEKANEFLVVLNDGMNNGANLFIDTGYSDYTDKYVYLKDKYVYDIDGTSWEITPEIMYSEDGELYFMFNINGDSSSTYYYMEIITEDGSVKINQTQFENLGYGIAYAFLYDYEYAGDMNSNYKNAVDLINNCEYCQLVINTGEDLVFDLTDKQIEELKYFFDLFKIVSTLYEVDIQ